MCQNAPRARPARVYTRRECMHANGIKTGSTKLKNTCRYFPKTQNEKNKVTEALKYLDTRILLYCVYRYQIPGT